MGFNSEFKGLISYFSGLTHFDNITGICTADTCDIINGCYGGTVVKVLCYKSESRLFDPSSCHWNFSFT